jgi:hypothetical protein
VPPRLLLPLARATLLEHWLGRGQGQGGVAGAAPPLQGGELGRGGRSAASPAQRSWDLWRECRWAEPVLSAPLGLLTRAGFGWKLLLVHALVCRCKSQSDVCGIQTCHQTTWANVL